MAKKGAETCSWTLSMFMLLFLINLPALYGEELESLLPFRDSIKDPLGFLSNWSSSTSSCNWPGITCDNPPHVKRIELSGKNISGKISGSIFQLQYVEFIDLSDNQLLGEIPHNLFSCPSLLSLNLSNNNISGPLPSISISRLETLDLSNNMLSGKIPDNIGLLWSLKFLDLGGNILVGKIPNSISNLTVLQVFTLASNKLVGQIPGEIGRMKNLKWIYLGYNNLSDEIPKEIGDLTSLNHLDLVYNNLSGLIPSSLGNLTSLQYLFLYKNKLTGPIPRSLFNLKKLVSLDLSDNSLSGEIPELISELQNLEILHLFSNNLTGKIPAALASLPRLQVLQLWSNKLSGKIPEDLGRRNNLTIVDLSSNFLVGKIPKSLCNSGRLFKLILFSNSLQGEIPQSLSSCISLRRVRIQNNRLSGDLSSEFTKLPLVYFLDISGNNLSGRIDVQKWDMPSLEMLSLAKNKIFGELPGSFGSGKLQNLDLSENQFSGNIPKSFGRLSDLMLLQLSENKLSGNIPEELSSCKKLVSLDLSHNHLSGNIPISLAELPALGQLDLSANQLSGEIPPNLGRIESLGEVNISHNHFNGRLPSTGAFLAINASAVAGNDLCGGDASSGLPPCKSLKSRMWWYVMTCFLVALAMFALAALVILFIQRREELELKRVENEDGILWEMQFFDSRASKSITVDDILSSAKQENVIMRDGKERSYGGKSSMSNMQFVVKEMNDPNSIPPSFWSVIPEFGRLRHPNIIRLIGVCRSTERGFLVYGNAEGKNLSEILGNLSWERRRKIAIGIAKALHFLHGYCSPSVLVGIISPEKVLVDGKDEARLSLDLSGRLACTDNKCLQIIPSACIAPEARQSKDISEQSDIYGFGLFLIELLTGKSPADAEFGMHENIVEWARYCYSDCHLDVWIDRMIRGDATTDHNQNEIVETMNLALHCTATDPTARPCAGDVLKTLQSVLISSSTSCVSDVLKFSSTNY
ncbi:hypothetical protein I3843_07G199500 [Carya illinoinensis]|uniref:non-specific serine/threonine protein kinase n=1 Tax=Carya illinoinensis TaxID=32201 RepID=A0A8T1Q6G0_CARIL|nr:leucine-rich repeat receptor-like serine/threonine-protein kinase SKM1 isoform X2 [Carya illinoinensis]KAG2699632.1 hypothetical protein I3760_07G200300 [Carya illinoinensis]KAG2699633.1 hypothetical protein I3760_07G200300 [Carya illinoinensis]KAG2699634.1 hypothetical protein I3760_07G200300 [Carya illinoinensis]KAG2699637.1 hypothetical protein I3760_07G200300 [Carya illinoinensis]KAG6649312.1 hypothetical protein CIPAW_07G203300 [Carya illinoinensis]